MGYLNDKEFLWGALTVGLMFLPFMFSMIVGLVSFAWFKLGHLFGKEVEKPKLSIGWEHLPFVQGVR